MSLPRSPTTMVRALTVALKAADIDPRDAAAVNLARLLAKSVDEGRMQDAPKLLAVMTSLGLTPGGRKPVAAPAPSPAAGPDEPPAESGGAQGAAALAAIRAHRAAAAAAEGPQ